MKSMQRHFNGESFLNRNVTVNVSQGELQCPLESATIGLMCAQFRLIGTRPHTTWNIADSQVGTGNHMLGNINTPRILELDINCMMIGQNTISAQIRPAGVSNDRLVNAANSNLRSYLAITRPGPGLSPHRSLTVPVGGIADPDSRTVSRLQHTPDDLAETETISTIN